MIYKLPQAAYPYEWLIEENARRRGSPAMEFELIDTGIFDNDKYFDIEVEYAKADVDDVLMRVTIHNRGPTASIHVLPQIWFRNVWSWSGGDGKRPSLKAERRARARAARGTGHLRHSIRGEVVPVVVEFEVAVPHLRPAGW